ncbi:glutamine amidotransferase [Aquisphaera insulae]|uniref:glutamine amidotransferase n=1 Tax=Aquisphaera insulae TaxID=2712864 RepID=UPI0013E9E99A|nr:glutamine amidotransferase [Aquisphaera insulae]
MRFTGLTLGAPQWWTIAAALAAVAAIAILWSYSRARARHPIRVACAVLKALAIAALALILIEPLLTYAHPRPGANAFAILADDSQSLRIRDDGESNSRGEILRDQLRQGPGWQARLGQEFDVRRFAFDARLRSIDDFDRLTFDGSASSLGTSLAALSKRFQGLPLAGVLLFTDGNRTDAADLDGATLPPIYPVVPPSKGVVRDIGVRNVAASQTNFESAPVVLRAEVATTGFAGQPIVAAVVDEAGNVVERQQEKATSDGKPLSFRFQFRPDRKGIRFYTVRSFAAAEEESSKRGTDPAGSAEQTLANNGRLVVIDQGGGPYRILYVSGRPNWEFKFLHRAIEGDDQLQLAGLLRIARRKPKFDFQSKARDRTISPFYEGFDNADPETAERNDQPVLIRLGDLADEADLRDGFPKTAEALYQFHAIVIDDIEASFFTQDQLNLLRNFVATRGGGLLMLGGPDSFADGKYDRTPVGELLPVYLNAPPASLSLDGGKYRLVLTREGWLQPWVRTRKTEEEEQKRLASMPPFGTLSRVGRIKPGAVTLAEIEDDGNTLPALVAQTFGKGHVASLLIGDLWRWGIRRERAEDTEFDRSWRQTARWLVADVPGRVDVAVKPRDDAPAQAVDIAVRVRDAEYRPLDNAKVVVKVALPDGGSLSLDARPDAREPDLYTTSYVARTPGPHRFTAVATSADGAAVGEREAGWAAQPAAEEFARLAPDRELLASLAAKTGGEVVEADRLGAFVESLPSRRVPITELRTTPLWHHPAYLLLAIACLTAEWALRRLNNLA